MAKIPGGHFDGSKHQGDIVVPEGEYLVQMIWSEFKRNSSDTGDLLLYRFEILSGDHKGVEIFGSLNYTHSTSPGAEKMGKKELEKFRTAAQLTGRFDDTALLHKIPMLATIGIQEAQAQWPKKNIFGEMYPSQATPASSASAGDAQLSELPWEQDEEENNPEEEMSESFDGPEYGEEEIPI